MKKKYINAFLLWTGIVAILSAIVTQVMHGVIGLDNYLWYFVITQTVVSISILVSLQKQLNPHKCALLGLFFSILIVGLLLLFLMVWILDNHGY